MFAPSTPRAADRSRSGPALALAATALALVACHGSQARYRSPEALAPPRAVGAEDAIVYLVGDAGADSEGRAAVLAHLGADLGRISAGSPGTPVVVVYLGDNIYEVGARADHRDADLAQLRAQVDALGDGRDVRAYFLPGNHDWGKGAGWAEGRAAVLRQAAWLDEISRGRAAMIPSGACPGPTTVDVGEPLRLVAIDTEWLLRRPVDGCGSVDDFVDGLHAALAASTDRWVLLLAHHPMATGGAHGGNVGVLEYVPVLFYLATKSGLSVQDLASPRYSEMLDALRGAVETGGTRPLAVASGHDHSLQVVARSNADEPRFQLVSGSGSKRSASKRIDGTRYASGRHGYMRLDVGRSEVRLTVFELRDDDEVAPTFACALARDGHPAECPEAEHAR